MEGGGEERVSRVGGKSGSLLMCVGEESACFG